MNVIGIGTDITECDRIQEMINKHEDVFLKRVFTDHEIAYCSSRKPSAQHFAGRWAAKEAILKAIGTGWAQGIRWVDMEILNDPAGKPAVTLSGVAREVCDGQGIGEILISISHCGLYATAFATALAAKK